MNARVSPKTEKFSKSGAGLHLIMANLTGLENSQNMEIFPQAMDSDMLRCFGCVAHGMDESTISPTSTDSSGLPAQTRLQELTNLGLVHKIGTKYAHTDLGARMFNSQIEALRTTLVKRSDKLLLSSKADLSSSSDSPASEALTKDILEIVRDVTGIPRLAPVRTFHNWLDLSMETAVTIRSMKEDLHLATRYMDFRTAEIAVIAGKSGRRINILHGTRSGLSSKLQLLANLMVNPRAIRIYKEITANPNVSIRKSEMPYSFIIVDREKVGFEIVNPNDPGSFYLGFQFESRNLAARLIWFFDEMLRISYDDELKHNLESSVSKEK